MTDKLIELVRSPKGVATAVVAAVLALGGVVGGALALADDDEPTRPAVEQEQQPAPGGPESPPVFEEQADLFAPAE